MKPHFLLLPAFWLLHLGAGAQTTPPSSSVRRLPLLPPLPETALQPVATSTVLAPATTMRYQYQMLKVENDERAFLAPAWRGRTQLVPEQKNLFGQPKAGELEAVVMQTLNSLSEEGWELLEVHNLVRPVKATQKIETELAYSDPNRPTYTSSTFIQTYTETRYLFRRSLPK